MKEDLDRWYRIPWSIQNKINEIKINITPWLIYILKSPCMFISSQYFKWIVQDIEYVSLAEASWEILIIQITIICYEKWI